MRMSTHKRSKVRKPLSVKTKSQRFPIGGGLDVVTPPVDVKPGRALVMQNYEPYFNDGYKRTKGFERSDGQDQPHLQTFTGFILDTVVGLVAGTTVLTGDTSSETALVIDFDTTTKAVATVKLSGSLTDGESFNSSAYSMSGIAVVNQAPTDDLEKQFLLAAQNNYRADIDEIPGVNQLRGGWQRGSNVYGIRDNAGETAAVLHLQSASGWTTTGVTMAEYLFFNTGGGGAANPLPVEGDTINGLSSGATATVHRVITHTGAPATNDAEGYLVLTSVSGGPFTDTETIRVSTTNVATADGVNTAFSFPVGGVYQFHNHNFFGGSSTYRTYGANGVGPGFEIDENNIVAPILLPLTAMNDQPTSNVPFLIKEHRNYIFLAFPGGIFQHTVIGEPLVINEFLGAGEFGVGDEITGMNSTTGGVLSIFSEKETRGLFGKDISDWELKLISEKTGSLLYSSKVIGDTYSLSDLGVNSLDRTDKFGDFLGSTVSQLIQPLVNRFRDTFTDSVIVRQSNQYKMYFSDGSCIVMYVPDIGSVSESRAETQTRTRVQFGFLYYPVPVVNIYNTQDENGSEVIYFISTDGYLYKDQVGKNFDGAAIEAYVRLVFNNINSPTVIKRIRRAFLEMDADDIVDLTVHYEFDYADSNIPSGQMTLEVVGGGAVYDDGQWDEIYWDAQLRSSPKIDIDGSGENIAIVFYSNSAVNEPHTLQGLNMQYEPRRLRR